MLSACSVYFSMFHVLETSEGMEGGKKNRKAGVILGGLSWHGLISYKFSERNFRHNEKKD